MENNELIDIFKEIEQVLSQQQSMIVQQLELIVQQQAILNRMNAFLLGRDEKYNSRTKSVSTDISSKQPSFLEKAINERKEDIIQPKNETQRTIVLSRYVTNSEEDDGFFYFRRSKEEKNENDYFVVHLYDDNTGTFEFVDDVVGEKMQTLIDNAESYFHPKVVVKHGNPTANSRIKTEELGVVKKEGKSFQIIKPLKISFT